MGFFFFFWYFLFSCICFSNDGRLFALTLHTMLILVSVLRRLNIKITISTLFQRTLQPFKIIFIIYNGFFSNNNITIILLFSMPWLNKTRPNTQTIVHKTRNRQLKSNQCISVTIRTENIVQIRIVCICFLCNIISLNILFCIHYLYA